MRSHSSKLNEVLSEKRKLLSVYRHYRRNEYEKLCNNEIYGKNFEEMAKMIRRIGPDDGMRLVEETKSAMAAWMSDAPDNIRYMVLSMIDDRCMAIRMRLGMPPLDDPVPGSGEPDTVFRVCKAALRL